MNDDAQKLESEYGPEGQRDPLLIRLRQEMRECNELYAELLSRLEREPALATSQGFIDHLDKLRKELGGDIESETVRMLQEPLPQSSEDLDAAVARQRVSEGYNIPILFDCTKASFVIQSSSTQV